MFLLRQNCDHALFLVRILVGVTFIVHGGNKLITLLHSGSFAGLTKLLASIGFPAVFAYLVMLAELLGGSMILCGIATEIGALFLAIVMIGALFFVHLKYGYFLPEGYEYTLNLLVLNIALIIGGPGSWYLWNPFFQKHYKQFFWLLICLSCQIFGMDSIPYQNPIQKNNTTIGYINQNNKIANQAAFFMALQKDPILYKMYLKTQAYTQKEDQKIH